MERRFYLRGLGIGIAVTAVIMGIITSRDGKMTDSEIIARARELGMVENTVLSEANDEMPEEADNSENADQKVDMATGDSTVKAGDTERDGSEAGTGNMPQPGNTDEEDSSAENEAVDGAGNSEKDGDTGIGENEEKSPDDSMTGDASNGISDRENENDGEDGVEPVSAQASEEETRDLITSAAVKTITVNSGDGSHTVAQKLADAGVVTSAETFDAFLCQNGYDKKLRTGTFSIPADASDEQIARIVTGAE